MRIRPFLFSLLVLSIGPIRAQPGPFLAADLRYAAAVCTDTTFAPPMADPIGGDMIDLAAGNRGCLASGERNGIWMNFTVAASGRIGFTVTPTGIADFDFGVWGPFTESPDTLLVDPVRCSFSALSAATGANFIAQDLSEAAGGDSWVKALDVSAGEHYVLYVMNFSVSGIPFDLTWQFADGAQLACLEVPVAAFQQSMGTIVAGQSVSFTDQSTGGPFAWYWEFQGGIPGTSEDQDPQAVQYDTPGCYDVNLTAFNAAGENTVSTTCQVLVEVSTGIGGNDIDAFRMIQQEDALRILPANGATYSVDVLDALGRRIRTLAAQGPLDLSTAGLPTGPVLLAFEQAGMRRVQRFIVP